MKKWKNEKNEKMTKMKKHQNNDKIEKMKIIEKMKKTCGGEPNQQHVMSVMDILSHFDLWQPVMINADSLTDNNDYFDTCAEWTGSWIYTHADVRAMVQHRDLNLCHDLSHYLFQTCLIHNSAPHTASHLTLAVSSFAWYLFHCVTIIRPHWASLPTWLEALSRFPIEDGWMETHRVRLLSSIPRVSLPVHNSCTALLLPFNFTISCSSWSYNFGIPIRDRQKTSQALSSRRHPLFVESHVDAIVTPELRFAPVVIATCNPIEKLTPNTMVAATPGLVLTHDGNAPQHLYQCISTIPCIQHLHQLPQLTSRIPWETPSPLFRVVDDIISHASQSHASWLPCNLWFSCHVYISSWQVRIEYSTDTAKQSHSNRDEQHNTQLWPSNRSSPVITPVPETTGNCSPAQAATTIIPIFVIHLSMLSCSRHFVRRSV